MLVIIKNLNACCIIQLIPHFLSFLLYNTIFIALQQKSLNTSYLLYYTNGGKRTDFKGKPQ